jgi:hypothetical protein
MGLSSSWEAANCSLAQEYANILWMNFTSVFEELFVSNLYIMISSCILATRQERKATTYSVTIKFLNWRYYSNTTNAIYR